MLIEVSLMPPAPGWTPGTQRHASTGVVYTLMAFPVSGETDISQVVLSSEELEEQSTGTD